MTPAGDSRVEGTDGSRGTTVVFKYFDLWYSVA